MYGTNSRCIACVLYTTPRRPAASARTGQRGQRGGVAPAPASGGNAPTTMHPLRVRGSERKSLAGTTVDEFTKIGRWKAEKVGISCIGSGTCTRIQPSKRKRDHACATASELPLPPAVELVFSALTYASIIHSTKQVWVRQGSARLVANDELRNAKRPHPIKYLY